MPVTARPGPDFRAFYEDLLARGKKCKPWWPSCASCSALSRECSDPRCPLTVSVRASSYAIGAELFLREDNCRVHNAFVIQKIISPILTFK